MSRPSRIWPWLAAGILLLVPSVAMSQAPGRSLPGLERPLLGEVRPGPLTLTPSLTVVEEYNDNIFLNNAFKRSDFVTSITPSLTLAAEGARYRLAATYDFTARLFARNSDLDNAFDRQTFTLGSLYRATPTVTLGLDDTFSRFNGVNSITPEGVATGRNRSSTNTLRPNASWQIDPLWSLRGAASWTAQRFDQSDLLDSDTYRAEIFVERVVTPRLRVSAGYQFAHIDIDRSPDSTTHTPRVGLSYLITPTLIASVSGGPSIEVPENRGTRVTPAVSASLIQRFERVVLAVGYDRIVDTAGGLGGTSDNQTVRGSVVGYVTQNLTIEFGPQYRTFESRDNSIDVRVFSMPLQISYRITPWLGLAGGYVFFRQRSDSTVRGGTTGRILGTDVDQNRVFLGLQIGYPFRFD